MKLTEAHITNRATIVYIERGNEKKLDIFLVGDRITRLNAE